MSFHITDLQDSIDPIWHSIRQDEAQQELLDCTELDLLEATPKGDS